MHCGETSGKKCWKIKQANQAVLRNPHKAGKSVLDSKCEICLKCEKRTLDDFKIKFLSDFLYNATLSHLRGLPSVFCLLLKQKICLRIYAQFGWRDGSSPGTNMIPYELYKKCPQIAPFFFKIVKSTLIQSTVLIHWRVASEVYIPKKKSPNLELTENFWLIALINVERRLFFSLLSQRLEDHIIKKNRLIDLSIQKECMAKVPGSWEHMSLVWKELKAAKTNKLNLAAVWLDIANAYGYVPHQLTFFAFEHYAVWILYGLIFWNHLVVVSGANHFHLLHHLVGTRI